MRWTEAQLAKHLARHEPAAQRFSSARKLRVAGHRAQRIESNEGQIHQAVVGHLRMRCRRGVHWHHPATGELRDAATAAKLQRMGVRAGLPDLLLLIEGRLHGLELKRERGGRVSPAQQAMHDELRAAGAIVETAKGLNEALGVLTTWGALLPDNQGKAESA